MKLGDIVQFNPNQRWLTREERNANGIILAILDGGSHRKNTSYQVMWSSEVDHGAHSLDGSGVVGWYVEPSLVKVD